MSQQIQVFILKWRFPLLVVLFASDMFGTLTSLATHVEWAYLLHLVCGVLLLVYFGMVRWSLNSRYPKRWRDKALFAEKAPWRRTGSTVPGMELALTDQSLLHFPCTVFAFPAVVFHEFVVPYSRIYRIKAVKDQISIVFFDDGHALREVNWGGESISKIAEILQQKCGKVSFEIPPVTLASWLLQSLPLVLLFVSMNAIAFAIFLLLPTAPVNNAANNPANQTLLAFGMFAISALVLFIANWTNKYRLRNGF